MAERILTPEQIRVIDHLTKNSFPLGDELTFDEEQHKYFYKGMQVEYSVTQILKATGITSDYSCVDPEVLEKARAKGTYVHMEIEHWVRYGKKGFTTELQDFIRLVWPLCDVWYCEVSLYRDGVAGRLDLLGVRKDGTVVIVDTKTGTFNRKAVSWQDSIYSWLLALPEDVPVELYCFDAKADGSRLVQVEQHSTEDIEGLFQKLREGKRYEEPSFLLSMDSEKRIMELMEVIEAGKKAQEEYENLKAYLLEGMESTGMKELSSSRVKVTYKAGYIRQTTDTAKFKKEHPDMGRVLDQYKKESSVKATVLITLKEDA